ncbi:cytochrome P460 family protein [Mucilaginibacter calamicampi]|uniref:Cytochrome P460 family protein n=1 Tax=Mucilaginibacter calamicampi TaxID=1302352 RepID=A0ABW2YUL6_9SPHI
MKPITSTSKLKSIFTRRAALLFGFTTVAFTTVGLSMDNFQIPYPEDYRHWTHVKTAITGFNKTTHAPADGYQHIYANNKALIGYKTGVFPDGSSIVFDKHEVDTIADYLRSGKRKFIDVMYKDGKRFKETGGWGFEEFKGDSKTDGRITGMHALNCYKSCHQKQDKTDAVFSSFKD